MKKFTFVLAALAAATFSFAQETTVVKKTVNDLVTELKWGVSSGNTINGCYTNFALDNSIQISTTGEANCGSVWGTSTNDWRLYQNKGGNVIISSIDESVISTVKLTYTISKTGVLLNGTETCTSNTAINVNATSITLTVGNSTSATNGQIRITAFEVTYTPAIAANVAAPVLTAEEGKVTDGNFTEAFTLTMTCATEGASIYYTLDGTDPAESETAVEYTEAITISAKSTKVRAIAMDGTTAEFSREATATYCYVNTAATAYTATEAIAVIDAGLGLNNKLYVKGSIKSITELSTQYGNATYVITDGTSDLTIFRGKYLEGEKFTSEDQLTVGDEVVVYGLLKLYGETYEVDSNNELVSLTPGTGSRIDNATEAVKAVKVIENGQMVIIRGGVKYNAQGAVIE